MSLARSGCGDEVAADNSGLHAPVVIAVNVAESPPDAGVVSFVILKIRRLGRVISGNLDAVRHTDVFEIGSRDFSVFPDVSSENLIVQSDVHLAVPLMKGKCLCPRVFQIFRRRLRRIYTMQDADDADYDLSKIPIHRGKASVLETKVGFRFSKSASADSIEWFIFCYLNC